MRTVGTVWWAWGEGWAGGGGGRICVTGGVAVRLGTCAVCVRTGCGDVAPVCRPFSGRIRKEFRGRYHRRKLTKMGRTRGPMRASVRGWE